MHARPSTLLFASALIAISCAKTRPIDVKKNESQSLLGSWEACEKTSSFYFDRGILSTGAGYIFNADGTFHEYFTIFKDADCKQALTQQEADAAGLTNDFVVTFNETDMGGFRAGPMGGDQVGTIDFFYAVDDVYHGEDAVSNGNVYLSYKIEGNQLSLTSLCSSSTVCDPITGDSAEHRAVNFAGARTFQKK